MPYSYPDNVPDYAKNLPAGAQKLCVTAFNETDKKLKDKGVPKAEREEKARQACWGAVKSKYKRLPSGKWVKKMIGQFDTERFVGSPRNKYGTHSSKGFKGNYAQAWRIHFSRVGGGAITAKAAGPIRGTVRRCEMIAAAMKPSCALPKTDDIPARTGPKSPLKGDYPEKPSDYGLKRWAKPSDDGLTQEDIRFTCDDLKIIKKAALAEIKWRAKEREKEKEGKRRTAGDVRLGDTVRLYLGFSAKDEVSRKVKGYATSDTLDTYKTRVKHEAVSDSLREFANQYIALKEMHKGLSAAGTTDVLEMDDSGLWTEATVVDDQAWRKVLTGVYRGFSIGFRILKWIEENGVTWITKLRLREISLVDAPSNPDALFQVVTRRQDMEDGRDFFLLYEDEEEKDAEAVGRAVLNGSLDFDAPTDEDDAVYPDEAYAVIEPAFKRGETEDEQCRHLRHHTAMVADPDSEEHIDEQLLEEALNELGGLEPATASISRLRLNNRARAHIMQHCNRLGWFGQQNQSRRWVLTYDDAKRLPDEAYALVFEDPEGRKVRYLAHHAPPDGKRPDIHGVLTSIGILNGERGSVATVLPGITETLRKEAYDQLVSHLENDLWDQLSDAPYGWDGLVPPLLDWEEANKKRSAVRVVIDTVRNMLSNEAQPYDIVSEDGISEDEVIESVLANAIRRACETQNEGGDEMGFPKKFKLKIAFEDDDGNPVEQEFRLTEVEKSDEGSGAGGDDGGEAGGDGGSEEEGGEESEKKKDESGKAEGSGEGTRGKGSATKLAAKIDATAITEQVRTSLAGSLDDIRKSVEKTVGDAVGRLEVRVKNLEEAATDSQQIQDGGKKKTSDRPSSDFWKIK
jgi:HK97 family phage prohead protease